LCDSLAAQPSCETVRIREAAEHDWPQIYPFFSIVAEGRTYTYPENLSSEGARTYWMQGPPGRTVVAVDAGTVLGTASMGPNRPGRGLHVAAASIMVDPPVIRGVAFDTRWASTLWTGRVSADTTGFSSTPWLTPTRQPCNSGSYSASRSLRRSRRLSIIRSTGSLASTSCLDACRSDTLRQEARLRAGDRQFVRNFARRALSLSNSADAICVEGERR